MGTAITKHPVPDRVKSSFVIFDIRTLWRSGWSSECPDVKNYKCNARSVQWPWVIANLGIKVTLIFKGKYLKTLHFRQSD